MKALEAKNFSLKATLESGQVFRWEKIGGWHYVTVGNAIIKIKQQGNEIIYGCSSRKFDVPGFFGLNDKNYDSMIKGISGNDKKIAAAVKKHAGLRIIRQEPWECTASFICSSFSNVKRIRRNLNAIAEKFGKKIEFGGYRSCSFPTAAAISRNAELLESCGLGYRAEYLAKTAALVSKRFDFDKIRDGSYSEAKRKLMELDGIGNKVADCILLFSLGFTEAFPVDVWVEREMRKSYAACRKMSAAKIAEYGRQKFGKNAGYAQQFIYHNARNRNI